MSNSGPGASTREGNPVQCKLLWSECQVQHKHKGNVQSCGGVVHQAALPPLALHDKHRQTPQRLPSKTQQRQDLPTRGRQPNYEILSEEEEEEMLLIFNMFIKQQK